MKARLDALDRKQLIRLDLYCASYDKDAVVRIPDDAQHQTFPDGQAKRHVEVERDVLGAVTGGKVTEWSYYANSGCVDEITTTTTDAAGNSSTDTTVNELRVAVVVVVAAPVTTVPPAIFTSPAAA